MIRVMEFMKKVEFAVQKEHGFNIAMSVISSDEANFICVMRKERKNDNTPQIIPIIRHSKNGSGIGLRSMSIQTVEYMNAPRTCHIYTYAPNRYRPGRCVGCQRRNNQSLTVV